MFLLVFRLLTYCDVNEKNTILRQELSKLKVNPEDNNTYSALFQKVAFSNLSINVISEKFRMNLAFTIAIVLFILPLFIGGNIFDFSDPSQEIQSQGEDGESDTTLMMLKNILNFYPVYTAKRMISSR